MPKKAIFELSEILEILPHRPPFLFVDRVIQFIPDKMIVAEMTIDADQPWFKGHFPQKPIMPGVLVLDALAQTSGLLLGFSRKLSGRPDDAPASRLFYLASSHIKFLKPSFPGETLHLIAETGEKFGALYSYHVEALAGRKNIAKGTLTLAAFAGEI